ncbi:hypothetical protein OF820_03805 [Oceanotoga sp. DSM 15011]|nr:copper homeostasis protein CutC [Oceanotoga sp. DSM 15011]UYP00812.1 hypothetical protein OF820_03805 [Oceanotoga sp. DSM 15011]
MTLEISVDLLESAIIANNAGVDRIELCSDLSLGGTTPSYGLMKKARKLIDIELYPIIRPRAGDFLYNKFEFDTIKEDVILAKDLEMNGVVIGFLDKFGNIDKLKTKQILELAYPLKVTFHRAIDRSKDILKSIDDLIDVGVDRVLTSAGKDKAYDDLKMMEQIVKRANNKIKIMAGSGISEENILSILNTGVDDIHMSAKKIFESNMIFKKEALIGYMDDDKIFKTDLNKIKNIKNIIKSA